MNTMKSCKVVLVTPIYINHPSLYAIVSRFFASLHEHYPNLPVIAIDDASPLPHDFCERYHHENQGFTATVNAGLREAFDDENADIVIVANDDLQIKAGDLDRFFTLEKACIASPMDTSASNDDRFGACWGITREAWAELGPLDEQYKHFYSDLDYYLRAMKAGIPIIKWYDIVIDHPESATYRHVDKAKLLQADEETYGSSSTQFDTHQQ